LPSEEDFLPQKKDKKEEDGTSSNPKAIFRKVVAYDEKRFIGKNNS
jgi:hypothetical protein